MPCQVLPKRHREIPAGTSTSTIMYLFRIPEARRTSPAGCRRHWVDPRVSMSGVIAATWRPWADWWRQIQDAILAAESVVLVLSPGAAVSDNRRARMALCAPVRNSGNPGRCRGNRRPLRCRIGCGASTGSTLRPGSAESELAASRLVAQLRSPYQRVRVPFTAPGQLGSYVHRPPRVRGDRRSPAVGAGRAPRPPRSRWREMPVSESPLSRSLCVMIHWFKRAFADGVLWISIGETPRLNSPHGRPDRASDRRTAAFRRSQCSEPPGCERFSRTATCCSWSTMSGTTCTLVRSCRSVRGARSSSPPAASRSLPACSAPSNRSPN